MRLLPLALTLLAGVSSAAPPDLWRPATSPDPQRAAAISIDPALAAEVPPGRWRFTLTAAYFNLWSVADALATVRRSQGPGRGPVTAALFREAERRYPDEPLWLLDAEGFRVDAVVSRGLGRGWTVSLALPWLGIGAPHWDDFAERWHSSLGLPNANRDIFPRGATFLYAHGSGGTLEENGPEGGGLGDVTLAVAAPAGHRAGADHRVVFAINAPTGDDGTLAGSGGWEVGLQWFAAWRGESSAALVGAAYSHPFGGTLLGLEREHLWHVFGGVDLRVWRQVFGTVRVTLERSPLAELGAGAPSDPALATRYGLVTPLGRSNWLAFEVGQDAPGIGVAPDYSFHLAVGGSPVSGR